MKKYVVELSQVEQESLKKLLSKGKAGVRQIKRAQMLLAADQGQSDEQIAKSIQVHVTTVERIRKRLVLGGLDHALHDDPRPGGKVKLDGKGEAVLVALACSEPPAGHATWTMQMLAHRLVELGLVESLSDEAVRLRLKKTI